MAQTQMLEGTGEELQRLLEQFPKERFRLVPLTSPETEKERNDAAVTEESPYDLLENYLGSLRETGAISPQTATLAWNAWKHISDENGKSLPEPDASSGPNGELLYTWDKGEHHLELELFADGRAEFFYRNRKTGKLWEAEYTLDATLHPDTKERLSVFI